MKLTIKQWMYFLIAAIIFALVEAKGLSQAGPGDENVYFYMAKAVSEGQMPYRDFFYAHPPLHIFFLSVIIKIFGVSFFIFKSASLLFILMASFFLYKISLELLQSKFNDKHAEIISILSVILFLFSFTTMFTATFSIGMEVSVMLVMASVYFISVKRYFIGGVFAGLAGLTRFYALAVLFALFAFILVKKIQEKKILDFAYIFFGFFAVFGTVMIILAALYGNKFIEPVVKYHFLKPKLPNQRMAVYENVVKENWTIIFASLLFLFAENKKRFQIFLFITGVYLIFFLSLNVPAEFYLIIILPFLALIGAFSLVNAITRIKGKYVKYSIAIIIISVFLWNTAADVSFLEKTGFLEFEPLQKMVAKVSATSPDLKIFGDPSIAPLLALMSNRSIALNYIDSNEMTFTSGVTNFYIFAGNLDNVKLSYIIFRKDYGLHQIRQFRQYAESRCKLEQNYYDALEGDFLMYKC